MTDEDLLRRHLRAVAAVNHQLQAQLSDATGSGRGPSTGPRRASVGMTWLEQLDREASGAAPVLRSGPDGAVYVVEGPRRREVKSGLLATTLETVLGQREPLDEDQLAKLGEGAPVEVLEGTSGQAFVVIGGERLPIRGLPPPHPVTDRAVQLFPKGAELNVSAANVSRARFDAAISGRYQVGRVGQAVRRRGLLGSLREFVRRGVGRVRRLGRRH